MIKFKYPKLNFLSGGNTPFIINVRNSKFLNFNIKELKNPKSKYHKLEDIYMSLFNIIDY